MPFPAELLHLSSHNTITPIPTQKESFHTAHIIVPQHTPNNATFVRCSLSARRIRVIPPQPQPQPSPSHVCLLASLSLQVPAAPFGQFSALMMDGVDNPTRAPYVAGLRLGLGLGSGLGFGLGLGLGLGLGFQLCRFRNP